MSENRSQSKNPGQADCRPDSHQALGTVKRFAWWMKNDGFTRASTIGSTAGTSRPLSVSASPEATGATSRDAPSAGRQRINLHKGL